MKTLADVELELTRLKQSAVRLETRTTDCCDSDRTMQMIAEELRASAHEIECIVLIMKLPVEPAAMRRQIEERLEKKRESLERCRRGRTGDLSVRQARVDALEWALEA